MHMQYALLCMIHNTFNELIQNTYFRIKYWQNCEMFVLVEIKMFWWANNISSVPKVLSNVVQCRSKIIMKKLYDFRIQSR